MTETILTFGKYRQPVVICSAAMAGTTSPVTIAGTITVTNAEVLAGIILAQMANPGTPVIYGTASTAADLRSCAIAIGAPAVSYTHLSLHIRPFRKLARRRSVK